MSAVLRIFSMARGILPSRNPYQRMRTLLTGLASAGCRALILISSLFPTMSAIGQSEPPHRMFLSAPLPADGSEVEFNAPILRWPYRKGKGSRYEVALSVDSLFPSEKNLGASGLSGAFFNPHRRLEEGLWYWRYRVIGGPWSKTLRFRVTSRAMSMASPTAGAFLKAVPLTHPRILAFGGHERSAAKAPIRDAIRREAMEAVAGPLLTEELTRVDAGTLDEKRLKKLRQDAAVDLGHALLKRVSALCQWYRLSPDGGMLAAGVKQAREVMRWDPDGATSVSDFTDGACLYALALCFDTFHDRLPSGLRDSLVQAIALRAGRFHDEWVNNIESKVLSGHVWQLILREYFLAVLALQGHHPRAGEWLSYAYELFLARAPVLGGIDGGWAEGAYYLTMNMDMLVDIPETIRHYTGFDFIRSHPWYRAHGMSMLYHVPPGSRSDGFGDNTEDFTATDAYGAFAEVMYERTGEASYGWYLTRMRAAGRSHFAAEPVLRWHRLTMMDAKAATPMPVLPVLPLAQLSRDVGMVAMHTDLLHPDRDVMVAFRSGRLGAYGHVLADQNTFNVVAGGRRLFYRTGYKVAMDDPHRLGWSKHTKSMNGVLVNGNGQPYTAESYGNISGFLQGDRLAYVQGDASNAYRSRESGEDHGLVRFLRHLVLLRPGVLVVYDELEGRDASEWSWLLHSIEGMRYDSITGRFRAKAGGMAGEGRLWASTPLRPGLTDTFEVPAIPFRGARRGKVEAYPDQWHFKAVNRLPASRMRFLSVMYIGAEGHRPEMVEMPSDAGILRLRVEGWELEASLSAEREPMLRLRSTDGAVAFSAYGSQLQLDGRTYTSAKPGNSLLVERRAGKPIFTQCGEMSTPMLR